MAEATIHQLVPTPPEEEVEVKNCIKCSLDKPLALFRYDKRCPDNRSNVCYVCYNKNPNVVAGKRKHAESVSGRFSKAKCMARRREIEFTLTFEQYIVLISQPCYYCKGKLGGPVKLGTGLDRLHNEIGYVIGNVVSCCNHCNGLKSDWLSPEETLAAISVVLRMRGLQ